MLERLQTSLRTQLNRDHVDASLGRKPLVRLTVSFGEGHQTALFRRCERFQRGAHQGSPAAAHLNERQQVIELRNDVDLAFARAEVTVDYMVAFRFKMLYGQTLREVAQRAAGIGHGFSRTAGARRRGADYPRSSPGRARR